MSSPDDEVSVWGAGFSPGGRKQTRVPQANSTAPQAPGLGSKVRTLVGGAGSGGQGRAVLWGREDRLGSLAGDKGEALQLADESVAAILWQVSDLDILGVRRYLSLESYAITDVSSLWADLKAGPSSRGTVPQSCGAAVLAEAGSLQVGGAEAGRAWGNPKRGTKSRLNVAADHQQPPSEGSFGLLSGSESSDDFSEIELMRVSIYPKGGQAKLNSLKGREKLLLSLPDPFLSSVLRGFTSVVERQDRQGNEELNIFPPKKCRASSGGRMSASRATREYQYLPCVTPRRKREQEKKSLGGVSKPALGRTFPSWEQRTSSTPLEPSPLPPVSGIPLFGRSKKYALVPWGAKESKHMGAGVKSVARRAREAMSPMAVVGEDNDPNRDPVTKGQFPTHWAWPSSPWAHHGEPSSDDLNIRDPQNPGNSEPLTLSLGEVVPRGPEPSDEWGEGRNFSL
ncbi:hypothetical protein FD755_025444, partial [Muntiacus reevesi]